jgi:D-amino-acid dehydrogenase
MKSVVVIGGGIIGLSSAMYLQQSGCRVTVIDKSGFSDNCSYGNAGYVCPSHFIPLANPGVVRQGIKWMLDAKSPFYIQPRLDWSLINWAWKFVNSAGEKNVEAAAVPLRDIALISQKEYAEWSSRPGFDFAYEHKGLLEIFQTEAKEEHARHTVHQALDLGLETVLLNREELQALEPDTKINARGAILFKCDSHLYPNRLMQVLIAHLRKSGVNLVGDEEVTGFERSNGLVKKVKGNKNIFEADEVVVATGTWSRQVAAMLDTRIPLVPGRGYSVTLENSPYSMNHPAVLVEGRVAITPMDANKIRFGGTMEITSSTAPPKIARVQGILNTVRKYFPDFDIPLPSIEKVWYGFRPCSADGLPYIGRISSCRNVVVATGHSMLGLSLGAGTGKLVSELVNEKPTSMNMAPFAVERFN